MGRYVKFLETYYNLNRDKISRTMYKHTVTKMIIQKIDEYDEAGLGPFLRSGDFWKEVAEAYYTVHSLPKKKYSTIIDAGTGYGFATAYLAHRFPDAKIIGIDIKETKGRRVMWELFEELYPERIEFIVGDVNEVARKIDFDLLVGIHNCKELSVHDIEIAAEKDADVFLVPCCIKFDALEKRGIDLSFMGILGRDDETSYMKWILGLAMLARKYGYSVKTGWINQLEKFTPKAAYLYASR